MFDPLYMENLKLVFTNCENPDEMLHYVAFNQGLNCLLRKKELQKKCSIFL